MYQKKFSSLLNLLYQFYLILGKFAELTDSQNISGALGRILAARIAHEKPRTGVLCGVSSRDFFAHTALPSR